MDQIIKVLAEELGQKQAYIENVVSLLDEGNSIPKLSPDGAFGSISSILLLGSR